MNKKLITAFPTPSVLSFSNHRSWINRHRPHTCWMSFHFFLQTQDMILLDTEVYGDWFVIILFWKFKQEYMCTNTQVLMQNRYSIHITCTYWYIWLNYDLLWINYNKISPYHRSMTCKCAQLLHIWLIQCNVQITENGSNLSDKLTRYHQQHVDLCRRTNLQPVKITIGRQNW